MADGGRDKTSWEGFIEFDAETRPFGALHLTRQVNDQPVMGWNWKSISWTDHPGDPTPRNRPPDEVVVRDVRTGLVRRLSPDEVTAWWPGGSDRKAACDLVRDQFDRDETWRDREPLL